MDKGRHAVDKRCCFKMANRDTPWTDDSRLAMNTNHLVARGVNITFSNSYVKLRGILLLDFDDVDAVDCLNEFLFQAIDIRAVALHVLDDFLAGSVLVNEVRPVSADIFTVYDYLIRHL